MARLLPSANGGGRIVVAGQPEQDIRFPGEITAIATNLTGAYTPPATGVVQNGWMRCDGAAIPISNVLSGTTPNASDERFLVGSTSAGATGGSNTQIDHTHGFGLTAAGQGGGATGTDSQSTSTTSGESGHTHSSGSATYNGRSGTTIGGSNPDVDYVNRGVIPATGGSSGHTHTYGHTHGVSAHTHNASSVSGSIGSGSVATSTNSRPQYVSVIYMIKVS